MDRGSRRLPVRGAAERVVFNGRQEAARADAEEMLRLIESVFEDEPDVFTKRSFLIEMADSPEVGKRVLELVERSS